MGTLLILLAACLIAWLIFAQFVSIKLPKPIKTPQGVRMVVHADGEVSGLYIGEGKIYCNTCGMDAETISGDVDWTCHCGKSKLKGNITFK
jgi:hypothetical protein